MLYTAAIMICLVDVPQDYKSCQVINAQYKYMTEEQCWSAVNNWVQYMDNIIKSNGHELVTAKCVSWFDPPQKQNKL